MDIKYPIISKQLGRQLTDIRMYAYVIVNMTYMIQNNLNATFAFDEAYKYIWLLDLYYFIFWSNKSYCQ